MTHAEVIMSIARRPGNTVVLAQDELGDYYEGTADTFLSIEWEADGTSFVSVRYFDEESTTA